MEFIIICPKRSIHFQIQTQDYSKICSLSFSDCTLKGIQTSRSDSKDDTADLTSSSEVAKANKSNSNHTTDSKLLSDEELLKTVMQMFQLEFLELEFTQNEMKVTPFKTRNIDQGY